MKRVFMGSLALPAAGLRAWALCAVALVAAASAQAANVQVQVQVQDASGKPIEGAVVFLESEQARRQVQPVLGLEMAQDKKQFVPQVLVVPVGSEVRFPNRDTVRHHVYSFSPAKKFELKLYAGTPTQPVRFDQPGVVVLGCNIHDQMVAWMLVLDTPYYAQSNATGQVQLSAVPTGSYRLRTWHSVLPGGAPALDQALDVTAAGAKVTVRLTGLTP